MPHKLRNCKIKWLIEKALNMSAFLLFKLNIALRFLYQGCIVSEAGAHPFEYKTEDKKYPVSYVHDASGLLQVLF